MIALSSWERTRGPIQIKALSIELMRRWWILAWASHWQHWPRPPSLGLDVSRPFRWSWRIGSIFCKLRILCVASFYISVWKLYILPTTQSTTMPMKILEYTCQNDVGFILNPWGCCFFEARLLGLFCCELDVDGLQRPPPQIQMNDSLIRTLGHNNLWYNLRQCRFRTNKTLGCCSCYVHYFGFTFNCLSPAWFHGVDTVSSFERTLDCRDKWSSFSLAVLATMLWISCISPWLSVHEQLANGLFDLSLYCLHVDRVVKGNFGDFIVGLREEIPALLLALNARKMLRI